MLVQKTIYRAKYQIQNDFYENGPVSEFTVSIYAVSPMYLDNVTGWLDKEIFGGLPLIPKRYYLCSKTFKIGQK